MKPAWLGIDQGDVVDCSSVASGMNLYCLALAWLSFSGEMLRELLCETVTTWQGRTSSTKYCSHWEGKTLGNPTQILVGCRQVSTKAVAGHFGGRGAVRGAGLHSRAEGAGLCPQSQRPRGSKRNMRTRFPRWPLYSSIPVFVTYVVKWAEVQCAQ